MARRQLLLWAHCSASITLAARVASFKDVTRLPQKDRTHVRRGGSAEWPDVEITLSLVGQELPGACAEPPSRPSAPRSGGGAQRRALTAVSTGAGCHEPTGMSFARTRLAVESTTPRVAGIVRQRPPLSSIYCGAMRPLAHHLGEPQQVLKTKWRTPVPRHHRRIRWRKVRPANGNRPDRAVGPLHPYPVFSPEGLGHHERKARAPKRMERMGDANLWCFCSTRCSPEL